MEKAILNVDNLYVTQGMDGSFSHKGDLAIDASRCKYLCAPFTGIVKRKYPNCNGIWLESVDKVMYADGSIDYMTIMTIHDNDISALRVGQVIKQGKQYYQPGTKGNVTGSHIHIGVGKGRYHGNGWFRNKYGNWCINNQYDITKGLFLSNKTNVSRALYKWSRESEQKEIIYVVKHGDNLSKIAANYGTNWKAIYEHNRDVIGNDPNLIKPGQKLIIE